MTVGIINYVFSKETALQMAFHIFVIYYSIIIIFNLIYLFFRNSLWPWRFAMPRNSFWSWSVITNYWRNGTWNWSKIIQFWQNWKSNNNKTKISKVFIQYLLTNSSYTYRVVKKNNDAGGIFIIVCNIIVHYMHTLCMVYCYLTEKD